jgi:3-deoxy-D-manno-octulosonic-acid transferase
VPLFLARLWWRGRNQSGYRAQLWRRLGWYGSALASRPHKLIWIHAVSVGETLAIAPIIERLLSDRDDLSLLITSTTPTGSAQVRQRFGERVFRDWIPFDTPGAVRRFFTHWQPLVGVFVETEIWPNMVAEANAKAIPMVLLNARLSQRSARGYARVSGVIRPTLAHFSVIAAQERADARRLVALGARPDRVVVTGNLKFAVDPLALQAAYQAEQERLGGALRDRSVWLAASTHPGEEEAVLTAFLALRSVSPNALLMLAPRHPERADSILALPAMQGLQAIRHSEQRDMEKSDDVLLIDTLGSLGALTGFADLVFVGGSLVRHGGHNPLEAAVWQLPILTGPHTFNFATIYVMNLIGPESDEHLATEMGARAGAFLSAQSGVIAAQWAALAAHLP